MNKDMTVVQKLAAMDRTCREGADSMAGTISWTPAIGMQLSVRVVGDVKNSVSIPIARLYYCPRHHDYLYLEIAATLPGLQQAGTEWIERIKKILSHEGLGVVHHVMFDDELFISAISEAHVSEALYCGHFSGVIGPGGVYAALSRAVADQTNSWEEGGYFDASYCNLADELRAKLKSIAKIPKSELAERIRSNQHRTEKERRETFTELPVMCVAPSTGQGGEREDCAVEELLFFVNSRAIDPYALESGEAMARFLRYLDAAYQPEHALTSGDSKDTIKMGKEEGTNVSP